LKQINGHKPYLTAVEDAFGSEIDYATLQKIYGVAPEQGEVRYSPAQCMGARKAVISGNPDFRHVSTKPHGAAKPDDADADAQVHAADKCLFKKN
jgi:uncharacterized Fe-S cluster protein YjdI